MNIPVSYLETKKNLTGEYLETFEHIESYCKTKALTENDLEDRLGYLLDVFAAAQAENVPVSRITGNDIKAFCRSFLSDCDFSSTLSYAAELLRKISWLTIFFILLGILFALLGGNIDILGILMQNSKTASCAVLAAGAGILTQIISSLIVRSFIFRVKKYRMSYHRIVNNAVYIAAFAGVLFATWNETRMNIPDAFVLIAAIIYLIGFYIVRGIINTKHGRDFFSSEKEHRRITFGQHVVTSMVSEFRDIYAKENLKRKDKGLPPLTHDEFREKMDKDTKTARKSIIIGSVSIAVFYASAIIYTALESTFTDALFFALVLLAALLLISPLVIHSLMVYPYLIRRRFFKIIDGAGKTVFDEDVYDCIAKYYEDNE